MSLVDHVNEVAYASPFSVDKIVRIFTGSYTSADLITRTGDIATPYLYRVAHNLTRPVFCEVIFSTDGGATYEDGGTNKLAFSDNTYVYIFDGYAPSGTVHYKVWCSWIDNYDNTDPTIETELYSSNPKQFDSRVNYQKIFKQDVLSFTPGTFGTEEAQIISHPFSYTPNAKVYFEAFSGEVWPLNAGSASNGFNFDASQDECQLYIKSGSVEVNFSKFSNQTRRAWYRIYYDKS